MEFDGSFGLAKVSPREKRKTQVDSTGIESVNGLVEFDTEVFVLIKVAGLMNKDLGKVGVDTPIPVLVGTGEIVSSDVASNSHVIEFVAHCLQTGFDIAKTLAISHLSETHRQELVEAGKSSDFVIASVTHDALAEFVKW